MNKDVERAAVGPHEDNEDVLVEQIGAGGVVTLNRPRALNALTTDMAAKIMAAMPDFARNPDIYALVIRSNDKRAFCAGGDVRELVTIARADRSEAYAKLAAEYEMSWNLECFSKPTLSLIDGMVMGSGVGLSAYGTHRVAGKNYSFAMPETMIGLFPDVGVASVLAQLPDEIGMYLGLTGARINSADALYLGLVTHCIPAHQFDEIYTLICDAEPIDPILDERHQPPQDSKFVVLGDVIGQCFKHDELEQIIAALQDVNGAHEEWAGQTLTRLAAASPLALKVTLRHIKAARKMDLRETLLADYQLACHFLAGHDFYEGVRAALIDKDAKPVWQPPRLKDVDDAAVDAYFTAPNAPKFELQSRVEMQKRR